MKNHPQMATVAFPLARVCCSENYTKLSTKIKSCVSFCLSVWVFESVTNSTPRADRIFPPDEIIPKPNDPEILPNPSLPEEEEYLPDEEETPLKDPRREIDDPYQPDREQDFPPEKEPEVPQVDPSRGMAAENSAL
tara:strand:- start:42146 stop:42553 length:408 start_codon:yes stop_codon:yes gene_type:complete